MTPQPGPVVEDRALYYRVWDEQIGDYVTYRRAGMELFPAGGGEQTEVAKQASVSSSGATKTITLRGGKSKAVKEINVWVTGSPSDDFKLEFYRTDGNTSEDRKIGEMYWYCQSSFMPQKLIWSGSKLKVKISHSGGGTHDVYLTYRYYHT